MRKNKVFYYTDEINDDFAKTSLNRPTIDENYKFIRDNKINNFFSFILFYFIVKPILGIVTLFMGVKVKNRKNLKEFKNKPVFIYANHTSYMDAFMIQARVIRFKRTNIIGYSDTSDIPVIKNIARACGYLPIPSTVKATKKLMDAVSYYISKNQNILIYPEAHIWPKYTKIRPFLKTSFHYPSKLRTPVIPMVSVYRKSKISKNAKITIVIGKAIYPRSDLTEIENKDYLRNECYKQMCDISNSYDQYESILYLKKKDNNDNI